MTNLTPFVLLLPLLGFIVLGVAGRALSRQLIIGVACGACGLAFLLAAISFFSMLGKSALEFCRLRRFLHLWQCGEDFLLGEIDVFESIVKEIIELLGFFSHCHPPVGEMQPPTRDRSRSSQILNRFAHSATQYSLLVSRLSG